MSSKLVIFSILSIFLFFITFSDQAMRTVTVSNHLIVQNLASVGITLGVAPSEIGSLAQQIREKEAELEARELAVVQAEAELQARRDAFIPFEWYVTILAFILLILVLLNFYLDWRREPVR